MTRHLHNEHNKFKRTSLAHYEDMGAMLEQRQAAVSQEWALLDQGWADLEEKTFEFGLSMGSPSTPDPVVLNVGGSDVYVPRFILEGSRGSAAAWTLGDLFGGGEWDKRLLRDSNGHVFLDESPVCFQHLVHQMSRRLDDRAGGLPELAVEEDLPADELPYLPFVAGLLLGLPAGTAVAGESTVLEASDVDALTATILGWCPGKPGGLELLYRASRDGWDQPAFIANSGDSSSTITLVRVGARGGNTRGSVVGGFSSVPWNTITSSGERPDSPGAFLFMVKDGNSASEPDTFQPVRWGSKHGRPPRVCGQTHGPGFGLGKCDFLVNLTTSPTSFQAGNQSFDIPAGSPYLELDGSPVTEVEVFRVRSNATGLFNVKPPAYPPPARQIRKGLIDCEEVFAAASMTMTKREHEDDIHLFGAWIADALKKEAIVLRHAQTELVQANARATASAQALAAVYGPDIFNGVEDPIIEFSVRGRRGTTRMATLLSTVRLCPPGIQSVLAVRFERWSKSDEDNKDAGGRQLIDDCSPAAFAKLLDVLRMKKRSGWESGDSSRGRRKKVRPARVFVNSSGRSEFEGLVNAYFPGCESFILDSVDFLDESPTP